MRNVQSFNITTQIESKNLFALGVFWHLIKFIGKNAVFQVTFMAVVLKHILASFLII